MMEHKGFVYRWTNTKSGMQYIGSHNGKDPKYIGCGPAFRKDYFQNPNDWEREILYRGKNIREVEREWIIKENAVASPLYYNNTTCTYAAMEGKTFSDEHRKKISEAKKNISDETRKKLSEAAKNMSDEHRKKISEAKKNISDETRKKIGEAARNISDETRKKMSETIKSKQPLTCPHCGKSGRGNVMYRHHFDKCKNV